MNSGPQPKLLLRLKMNLLESIIRLARPRKHLRTLKYLIVRVMGFDELGPYARLFEEMRADIKKVPGMYHPSQFSKGIFDEHDQFLGLYRLKE